MNPAEESRKRRDYDALKPRTEQPISPPPKRRAPARTENPGNGNAIFSAGPGDIPSAPTKKAAENLSKKTFPSPIQLNFVERLPASSNVDCISLASVLGDPMIKEVWLFNYLFDLDFVMKHFDPDTRHIVSVKVIHGSWKKEDTNGIRIDEAARRYPNINIIRAYMPEPYGTHHTKLMAIFRQDSLAQVIIMTANLIEQDFRMSQAFWKTPLLPLQTNNPLPSSSLPMLGTGPRFKQDLLAYFRAYGPTRLQNLVGQLEMYDFTAVRGALVASVPGKQIVHNLDPAVGSLWGLPSLRRILSSIPSGSAATAESSQQPHIVAQVSSIASVGEKWLLSTLIPALSTSTSPRQPIPKPKTLVVFPTAADIRDSVDGYGSGSSIHIKTSTPAQAKQLAVLTPMLCHWAGEMPPSQTPNSNHNTNSSTDLPAGHVLTGHANRARAAPHIKTYTRFTDHTFSSIDWAMMTSANLSIQAWGSTPNASGEVRVCSYEVGVLVWPGLWDEENRRGRARIVPVFGGDTPPEGKGEAGVEVGWRLPYSLPLRPYAADERPWCAREPCDVPDWMGRVWPGYGT